MEGLVLKNVSKTYKNQTHATLKNISLEVGPEEFLVLLGPSGCGKSTLLRIISGLVSPTEGQIFLNGEEITEAEPQNRHIGMVFQNYALFPHMTVGKNLAFPLEVAGVKRKKRHEIIHEVSSFLGIEKYLSKKPEMLSGGERQRVAMGRAMVKDCSLYLYDESLSNLDDNLRTRLRPEILKQFHELKVPFIYVTHDQVDAMTMGTKIAVMNEGVIVQMGTPRELYEYPANRFVAAFVGDPTMNLLTMKVEAGSVEGEYFLVKESAKIPVPQFGEGLASYQGKDVTVGIRPENILVHERPEETTGIDGVLEGFEHLGNKVLLYVNWMGERLCVEAPVSVKGKVGQSIRLFVEHGKVHLFDQEDEKRIKEDRVHADY